MSILKNRPKIGINSLMPVYVDLSIDWMDHFRKFGWTVVSLPDWNKEFIQEFYRHLDEKILGFSKKLPSTGIIRYNFGHTELQWEIRLQCAEFFSKLYNCSVENLLSSFDGGSFMKPQKSTQFVNWLHHDFPLSYSTDFFPVQGLVNFIDNGPLDGGLVLMDTRDIFLKYLCMHPEYQNGGLINPTDKELSEKKLFKICCPEGSLLLWDTRCIHMNVPPINSVPRMCLYVSMQPRKCASTEELMRHISYYERGHQTGHFCYGEWFTENETSDEIPLNPKAEKASLNYLGRRLVGYDS